MEILLFIALIAVSCLVVWFFFRFGEQIAGCCVFLFCVAVVAFILFVILWPIVLGVLDLESERPTTIESAQPQPIHSAEGW